MVKFKVESKTEHQCDVGNGITTVVTFRLFQVDNNRVTLDLRNLPANALNVGDVLELKVVQPC